MSIYRQIITAIFNELYEENADRLSFERSAIEDVALQLGVSPPRNLGDFIYSFRSRNPLPEEILSTAPEEQEWVIESEGTARYAFSLREILDLSPNPNLESIVIQDATPQIINRYATSDEQSLLTKIRYNRLVDRFIEFPCYHLQSHLITQIRGIGQIETDDVYIGTDKTGSVCVLPVQAKGPNERLARTQIENDFALCRSRFPELSARPVAAQLLDRSTIAMLEFSKMDSRLSIVREAHYRLVHLREAVDPE